MSDYIKVTVTEAGEGWVTTETENLDTGWKGQTVWRYANSPQEGQKLEFMVGHERDIVAQVGLSRAEEIVMLALARRRQYVIVEETLLCRR
jgi:hypothetical protein